jgi:hypothetical protein
MNKQVGRGITCAQAFAAPDARNTHIHTHTHTRTHTYTVTHIRIHKHTHRADLLAQHGSGS